MPDTNRYIYVIIGLRTYCKSGGDKPPGGEIMNRDDENSSRIIYTQNEYIKSLGEREKECRPSNENKLRGIIDANEN